MSVNGFTNFDILLLKGIRGYPFKHIPTERPFKRLCAQ